MALFGIFFSLFLYTPDTSSAIHMEATVVEMFVRTYQILNGIAVFGGLLNTTTHMSERIKSDRDSIEGQIANETENVARVNGWRSWSNYDDIGEPRFQPFTAHQSISDKPALEF